MIVAAKLLNPFMKIWYWYVSRSDRAAWATFLNYGYADGSNELDLEDKDEINRYPIQLYDHVADTISFEGLDALEVGSGRGGGASYIARYLKPESLVGLDICRKAVRFCTNFHSIKGLSFCHGDALNLPFGNDRFDVVLNVESSHRYADMNRFLREVCRVLRPGGRFLFTDFRRRKEVATLKKQLNDSGLRLISEQRITPSVIRALDTDDERRRALTEKMAPRFLHKLAREFAGTRGTTLYRSFVSGEREYLSFVLQKRQANSEDAAGYRMRWSTRGSR